MSKEELAKIELEIQKKLQPTAKNTNAQKNFRVNMDEVKRLAKKLNDLDQQKHEHAATV
jgi:hypothetical protein